MDELGTFALSFTVENKLGKLHKIGLFTFISVRYSITSNLRISQKKFEKYVFCWEKLNFEHIGNFKHTTEFLALGKNVNIYIKYLMFYPSRQHVKWKHFKYTSLHSPMIS